MLLEEIMADQESFFSEQELSLIDPDRIPEHVAIAMDGNRRWAKKRFLPAVAGHWKGAEVLMRTLRAASKLGVKILTVYGFSTENWTRPLEEVQELMYLFKTYLKREQENMVKEGVKLSTIGDISRFPDEVKQALENSKQATAHCDKIELILALNYGSRDEMRRAILSIVSDLETGRLSKQDLSESTISEYLDTGRRKDPDLLIRPSGEYRISNFLLWQLSYAEFYFTKTLWPDFRPRDLLDAIVDYQRRTRRLGGG